MTFFADQRKIAQEINNLGLVKYGRTIENLDDAMKGLFNYLESFNDYPATNEKKMNMLKKYVQENGTIKTDCYYGINIFLHLLSYFPHIITNSDEISVPGIRILNTDKSLYLNVIGPIITDNNPSSTYYNTVGSEANQWLMESNNNEFVGLTDDGFIFLTAEDWKNRLIKNWLNICSHNQVKKNIINTLLKINSLSGDKTLGLLTCGLDKTFLEKWDIAPEIFE